MEKKRRVLLAEENPEIVEYISSFLTFLGDFEIKQALSTVELLAGVNAFDPELVILDLNTTRVDSKQILNDIRKQHDHVKILVLTSRRGEDQHLKNQGAHEVVTKPVDFTQLSEKAKKLLHLLPSDLGKEEYARILIADDEIEIGQFLREEIFEPLGMEVHTAADGEEAIRVFREKACNLVLLDLKMPKIHGLDLIALLEKSIDPPPPKVIMIITSALAEALGDLKRYDYPLFDKPLDLELLKKRVLDTCEKHSLTLKKETGTSLKGPG